MDAGILFGIAALLCWGVADFLGARAAKRLGSIKVFFWSQLIGVLAMLPALFFIPIRLMISAELVAAAIAGGLLFVVGGLLFYRGLQVGSVSIVAPISAMQSVVTVLLSVLFMSEKLGILQSCAIALAILGTILVSFKYSAIASGKAPRLASGIPYAILSACFWGAMLFLVSYMGKSLGWFVPVLAVKTISLLLLTCYVAFSHSELSIPIKKQTIIPLAVVGVLLSIAFLSYGIGASRTYTSLIAPIATASPALTAMLAIALLRERGELNQYLGIGLVIGALILLSM